MDKAAILPATLFVEQAKTIIWTITCYKKLRQKKYLHRRAKFVPKKLYKYGFKAEFK